MRPAYLLLLVIALAACNHEADEELTLQDGTPFIVQLPTGFPELATRPDNPLTQASVALGKLLFFDKRLSRDATISCGSCHFPELAFSDTLPRSLGVDGQPGMRNAPPLINLAWHDSYFRDGGVPNMEQQVIAPVHDPVEMDYSISRAAAALRFQEPYATLSMKAYGRQMDSWVLTRAIANYERTLVSGWSRWDRWMQGETAALTESEQRGWQLFSSPELNCTACHGGFDLSDHAFHNVGQYLSYDDPGRERITLNPSDIGKFKTPTLRNIARTAPYMHDGSMASLEEVIDHFASGGLPHANRDPEMRTFALTTEDRADLIAFLRALNDERLIDQVQ